MSEISSQKQLDLDLVRAVKHLRDVYAVQMALDCGAAPDTVSDLNRSMLYYAAAHGDFAIVQLLLQFGADPNVTDDEDFAPLFAAVQNKHFDVADLLLACNANINVQAGDQAQRMNVSALHVAVYCDMVDDDMPRINFLMERNIDLTLKSRTGRTAAEAAREIGFSKGADRIENFILQREEEQLSILRAAAMNALRQSAKKPGRRL